MSLNISLAEIQATMVAAAKVKHSPHAATVKALPYAISTDILDDLASRFIINVPVEERENLIRICFQVELAHWFYLDFYCSENKQKCGIKQFAQQMFMHVPFLQPHCRQVDEVLENWKQYKVTVPTYGAILLTEDLKHVLLVQSFWAKSSWGFPKGKINENEEPLHCAIREVYEETGYDVTNLINPGEYIELVINYQFTRLYLVPGVPLTTVFAPKTRNEIKCCEWFPVDLLPVTKHVSIVKDNQNISGNSFFMILPFVKRLKKWVAESHGKGGKGNKSTGKGANHLQACNSPVFGRGESSGKQKIFFDNNIVGSSGGSGSKITANQQSLQQQAQRQRQRHKSMGEIDPQSGVTRVESAFGSPNNDGNRSQREMIDLYEDFTSIVDRSTSTATKKISRKENVNQFQQQSQQQQQQNGNQQFFKNSPNVAQVLQNDGNRPQREMMDLYEDFTSIVDGSTSATKKISRWRKRQDQSLAGSTGSAAAPSAPEPPVERPMKPQIKRKLFNYTPPTVDEMVESGKMNEKTEDPFLQFTKIDAWVDFKLDFSKFL
ncbi:m7GpppN-mRNA hydrolase [Anopheles bellator]|uniref:m7GpppN-mRNA hydrolase n=1 Tax=Anopheles bellator TaxID=139047 RepID=UPI002649E49B|nr:m7GpppN-mRNA hydrolase [Anopheles bellator]